MRTSYLLSLLLACSLLACAGSSTTGRLAVVEPASVAAKARLATKTAISQLAQRYRQRGWQVVDPQQAARLLYGARSATVRAQLQRFRAALRRGEQHLTGLRLVAAISALERARAMLALVGPYISRIELARVHFLLGLAFLGKQERSLATQAFSRAIGVAPGFVPSPQKHAPEVLSLYRRLKRQKSDRCKLRVESTPSGARVELNGKVEGTTPFDVMLAAGKHYMRARKTGYLSATRAIFGCQGVATLQLSKLPLPTGAKLELPSRQSMAAIKRGLAVDVVVAVDSVERSTGWALKLHACRDAPLRCNSKELHLPIKGSLSKNETANDLLPSRVAWYRTSWFWATVGGAVAIAVATAIIVPLANKTPDTRYQIKWGSP
jgi:hypothetical protein